MFLKRLFSKTLFLWLCLKTNTFYPTIEVFFSPDDGLSKKLVEKIESAQKSVHGAIYMLTDQKIADALATAANRGLEVCIIVDRTSVESPWGKCRFLIENKVKIFLKKEVMNSLLNQKVFQKDNLPKENNKGWIGSGPLMHNKYIIFDKLHTWTGSFNWTQSANSRNNENAILINWRLDVASKYLENFNKLLNQSVPLTETICKAISPSQSRQTLIFSNNFKSKPQISWDSFYKSELGWSNFNTKTLAKSKTASEKKFSKIGKKTSKKTKV